MASDIEYAAADSTTWKTLCVLAQTVRDLELQGDVAADKIEAKVYPRMFADENGVTFPCVFITPIQFETGISDSKHTAWASTFEVALGDVVSQSIHQRLRVLLRWHEAIRDALHQKATLKEAITTALLGGETGPKAWNIEVSGNRFFEGQPDLPRHLFSRQMVKVHFKHVRA